jgi:DNA-binding NarL/FixJ family response regulator
MVASRSSRFVPSSLLFGASCLLPDRPVSPPLPAGTRPNAAFDPDLTPAEQRVCELLLTGLSNKEIANELGRAEATIKNQVASILRKHGVPSRARLLALHR